MYDRASACCRENDVDEKLDDREKRQFIYGDGVFCPHFTERDSIVSFNISADVCAKYQYSYIIILCRSTTV